MSTIRRRPDALALEGTPSIERAVRPPSRPADSLTARPDSAPACEPAAPAGPGSGPSLKARAIRLLSLREHSRAELARKLASHAESAAQLQALLDELEARDYLSTARFVASLVHRRAPGHGLARLRQELQAKGVSNDVARDALAALQPTEMARAREVHARRYGAQPATDARERARQMRFLLARGFSAAVVRAVLNAADDDLPSAPDSVID